MTTTTPTRVGIYLRISRDAEGKELGVARQREDCERKARELGWLVVEEYNENDTSASTISKKPRPKYEAMIADVRAGRLDAILAYSNSRFTRRNVEFRGLIDLVVETGVIVETVVSGRANFKTADGRMLAKIMADIDEGEVERLQERVKRKHAELRATGAMVGARSFGFAVDEVGRLTGEHVPEEAALLAKAASDLAEGKATAFDILREWTAAGVTTTRGNVWEHRALRTTLLNPKIAGYRAHKGEIVRDEHGEPVMGQWKPIITPKLWETVVGRFHDKRRGRPGAVKHLLGGLVNCECGGVMHGANFDDTSTGNPVSNLSCSECRTAIVQSKVLPLVERAVASQLLWTVQVHHEDQGGVQSVISERLRALREAKANLLTLVGLPGFSAAEISAKAVAIDIDIRATERELDRRASRDVLGDAVASIRRDLLGGKTIPFADAVEARKQVLEVFRGLDLEKQQTIIRGTVRVTVKKAGKGVRMTARERVTIEEIAWPEDIEDVA